jgi:hypothetical protein
MSAVEKFLSSLPTQDVDIITELYPNYIILLIKIIMHCSGVRGHKEIAHLISTYLGDNHVGRTDQPPEPYEFKRKLARNLGRSLDDPFTVKAYHVYQCEYPRLLEEWRKKYPRAYERYIAKIRAAEKKKEAKRITHAKS